MHLTGKRILVTGASSGIGADLARELAAAGAELVLSARRQAELDKLQGELERTGARVTVVPADLSTPAGADALAAAAGRVDVLVNNAGIDLVGRPWKDGLADRGDRLMQLNLLSPLRLTNRLLRPMVERDDGAVVFIASVSAFIPFPGGAWYAASKAGLAGFAETLRIDLKGTKVGVLAVFPGPIHTPMLAKAMATEAGKKFFARLPKGDPAELARRTVRALARGEENLIYPAVYRTAKGLGGLTSWLVSLTAPAVKKRG